MRLKRCNAVCALAATLALFVHVSYCAFAYITFYYNPTLKVLTAIPFLLCVCVHASLGVYTVFFQADGTKMSLYQRQNLRTIVQRFAAFLIVPLLIVHLQTFSLLQGAAASKSWGVLALVLGIQLVFYAAIAVHTAISFSRALITLGLLDSRERQKRLDRVVSIFCAAIMLVAYFAVVQGQLAMFASN